MSVVRLSQYRHQLEVEHVQNIAHSLKHTLCISYSALQVVVRRADRV